ncbi:unnamed protein product [Microthlaspi erraticum]|uniref:RNase H type-1 domain-containing protein n=1 Tax=Microthlaspi erraticum TaxID=1685480 RepID=A0A6D2HJP8_9BRAS|nr:unnamed protein product [Microthlaspi erraticum]
MKWRKPALNTLKCNIGCSWHSDSFNSGASWLVRDHSGKVLLHSRRSYAMVTSPLEAELCSFVSAIESLQNLRYKDLILESPLLQARQALLEPHLFPQHRSLIEKVFTLLQSFNSWNFHHTSYASNRAAKAIANSVFEINKFQSYVAR